MHNEVPLRTDIDKRSCGILEAFAGEIMLAQWSSLGE
jgi:hypothetical protein